jgi:hypothetical protein
LNRLFDCTLQLCSAADARSCLFEICHTGLCTQCMMRSLQLALDSTTVW